MLDDFRLFYYGTEEPSDQTVGIKSQTSNLRSASPLGSSKKSQISKVYDLQGRRVSASQKGLVISREQQPDGSVVVRKIVK